MTNGDESVYPDMDINRPQFNFPTYGLRKREYFAALAMQGYIASFAGVPTITINDIDAKRWVEYADALIKALNSKTQITHGH
jgi:hypothetical protein